MLKFLKLFFGLFSPYVNSLERKVDKFFRNVKSTDSIGKIEGKLLGLMQKNLIVVNVWLEKKFKGYKYLNKRVRRKMYADVREIVKKLAEFSDANIFTIDDIKLQMAAKNLSFPAGNDAEMRYLYEIMNFLKPGTYYKYIKTASFGKLLRNPDEQKMEGDCNQIVTLYMYFYSLKFPLKDLKIKLLPEHVCLHFRGVDIEATTGTFENYNESREVLPATEIISTNLLDLTDFREKVQSVSPRVMVKSAQLAYAISSLKSLVAENLRIAYRNLAVDALNSNDFKTAIFYIAKAGDKKLLHTVYHNATVFYLKSESFDNARLYATKSGDEELQKLVLHNEGVYYFRKNKLNKALEIFRKLGDEKMQKACYAKQYNELLKKVAAVKTLDDAKKHRSKYRELLVLTQKMGEGELEKNIRSTLDKL